MRKRAWWSQTFDKDGPLIALSHESVGHWPGTRSDYDRARDARRPGRRRTCGSPRRISPRASGSRCRGC